LSLVYINPGIFTHTIQRRAQDRKQNNLEIIDIFFQCGNGKRLKPVFYSSFIISLKMTTHKQNLLEESQRKIELFEGLFEANAAVTSSLDRDEVLHLVMTKAQQLLHAEAASIFLIDEAVNELVLAVSTNLPPDARTEIRFPRGLGVAGWVAQTGETVMTSDITNDPRFYKGVQEKTGFHTTSYLCVPLRTQDRIIGTAQVMNRKGNSAFTMEELHIMEGFARQATIALENARLHKEELEKKHMEEELELAHRIQQDLLPKEPPQIAGYQIDGLSYPSRWVGGDYFDYLLPQKDRLVIVIADVCGKGIPASLLMSSIQAALHSLTPLDLSLKDIVVNLNRYLCHNTPDDKFATCFFAELNLTSHTLAYINCGHNPPFLLRKDGKIESLREGGLILGVLEAAEFNSGHLEIHPEDALLLYTDGVTEVHNKNREMFGEPRLMKLVSAVKHLPPGEIINHIRQEITTFAYQGQMEDDVTLVGLKRVE